jgi:hypothetical protein
MHAGSARKHFLSVGSNAISQSQEPSREVSDDNRETKGGNRSKLGVHDRLSTDRSGYFTVTVLSASMVTDFVIGEPFKGAIFTW